MSDKPEHNKLDSDCTLPPDHPLPADQLGRYSPERDFYAEKEIAEYVEGQARGEETVQNVERVKTEYVMGTPYEIWDVSTDKDRWWVITNPTNLYSQKHFPSLDYTLSFHVGLMMRVMSRSAKEGEGEGEASPFDEVIRRQVQAADRLEKAIEAVDFQAVGMQLRECLISLVGAARRRVELNENDERPKDADAVGWNRVLMGKLCPGEKNDELRSYMQALVEKAWPLVNWITHHRNANKTAVLVALDGVDAIVKHYVRLLSRERADRTDQCPQCASRNVRTFFDIAIAPDGAYFEACGECGWDSHPGYPEDDEEGADEAEVAEASHD
jgi:hypothetical protein